MKKVNYCIEAFVEKYNGIIQILLLALVIFVNCVIVQFGHPLNDKNDVISLFQIIITLIIGITLELILLHIKDSSAQRKINGIGEVVREMAKHEDLWKEENDLEPFFEATRNEFFISGIIIDKLITKYLLRIKDLLDRGIKVKILIESFDEIEEAAKFLYGGDYNKEKNLSLIISRLNSTLMYLDSLEKLEYYFSNNLLEIGLANVPSINPSIIAYDYTKGSSFEARRTELNKAPKMSVRFYLPGVDGPTSELKTHPTLLINSNIMAKQYDDFVKVIDNAWKSCTTIKSKSEFDGLKDKVTLRLEHDK